MNRLMFEFKLWRIRTRDNFARNAAKLIPKRIKMWAYIDIVAHATTGKYGNTVVPDVTAMEVLKRFTDDEEIK